MNTNEILQAIDEEIVKLQRAHFLLADAPAIQAAKPSSGKRRGRPKGSVNKKAEIAAPFATKSGKRTMSAEGKARIAAAQKARWAAQKKVAVKKTAAKLEKKATPPAKTIAKKPAAKKNSAKIRKNWSLPPKTMAAVPPAPAAEE